MATYALDNAHPAAVRHLGGLSGMFDDWTTDRLLDVEPDTCLEGASCLELGAGNGSIALWLAEQVGPDGKVVAVDIDTSRLPTHDRIEPVRADLTADPLPAGLWDVIHTRLTLGHLPNRVPLLQQLTARLAAGGTILVEDFNISLAYPGDEVLHAPTPELAQLWDRYNQHRGQLFTEAGTTGDGFTAQTYQIMVDAGLVQTRQATYRTSWRGGEAGSWHATGSLLQFAPQLVERGWFTEDEVETLRLGLTNPELHIGGRYLASTSGRAPA